MTRRLITTESTFEEEIGYSRAVIQDNWIFVSGTTGYNYNTMTISDDVAEQTEQCFINIQNTLKEADSSLKDVVRITYILQNRNDFKKCWPILKKHLKNIKPAATMFSAQLAEEKMKIEIQVTALKTTNT